MSQGGSLGGPEAAFPGSQQDQGVTGPEPTPENPGGVFPKSDPSPAPSSNDYTPPEAQKTHPKTDHSPDPPRAEPTATNAPVPGGEQARSQTADPVEKMGRNKEVEEGGMFVE
ncbi:hypothetical protein BDY24DRAFT_382290 [Mrakia frigida]|uniref:uncharacterized protein n=1 Tax=Mrakia frigida TaxID=29902 RepID=UPI003FCC1ABD